MPLQVIDNSIKKSMKRFSLPVYYYEGRLCSCVGENGGVPQINHTCNLGFYYSAAELTYVIRTAVSHKYLVRPQGLIFDGGATFTIPKLYNGVEQKAYNRISHGDIIVDSTKTKRDTDVLLRGVRDTIYAFDVKSILSIYAGTTQYLPDIDFTTSETSSVAGKLTTINWVDGKGPAEDVYYTVEFICNQQFKVWEDMGNDRGTSEDFLPKRVICVARRFVNYEQFNVKEIETAPIKGVWE